MQHKASLQQRWEDYRPTKAQAFWLAAGCVVATLIIGFGMAGWVTGGTAQQRINDAAQAARHELAAAVCVEEFMAAQDVRARLVKLKDAAYWDRTQLIAQSGFATMPDRKEANPAVASMCATRLSELDAPKA